MNDLRLGRWEDVLADVGECDAIVVDPPYSARTHEGQNFNFNDALNRRTLSYANWTPEDVQAFVSAWAPRNRGWFVCLSDSELCGVYRAAFEENGLCGFAPVGILIPGMTVRMAGDGPSSWMIYANVARPKRLSKWGTLPGGYTGGPGERVHIGGKPLWLMRELVRDYSREGDLVVDPCMGAGTTGLAAKIEGRRFIGAECDPVPFALAQERIERCAAKPAQNRNQLELVK